MNEESLNSRRSKSFSSKAAHVCKLHDFSSKEIETLRPKLLGWYDSNKRDLPWRKLGAQKTARDQRGYAVWVSEVMLQQTQVATVVEYYNKWMTRWPNLHELARASLEEVNEMWAGLGYYSRARRLFEGSKKVVNEMDGKMPADAASLMKSLPGVGKYTAAAIASIAFNQPVGLVDGNVVRVLSRLRAIGADSSSAVAIEMFWKLVDELVSQDQPGDFNQAMMELGATVCTPKSPQCSACPIMEICLAYKQAKRFTLNSPKSEIKSFFERQADYSCDISTDIEELITNDCSLCLPSDSAWNPELGVHNYPRKVKAKEARQERIAVFILKCEAKDNITLLFLAKRPSTGLLAGLWEFPNMTIETNTPDEVLVNKAKECLKEEFSITLPDKQDSSILGEVVHQFSHIHHTYVVLKIVLSKEPPALMGTSASGQATKWVSQSEVLGMAISTAMKKVYNVYKNNGQLKKTGIKRKRGNKASSKGQKVLDSFFVKT